MRILLLAGVALLASACATPVGVTRVDTSTAYRSLTESALSAQRPSEPSKAVLRRLGQLDRFERSRPRCSPTSIAASAPAGDEDRLFALAELSFLHGERTGDRAYFLAAAVYAYASVSRARSAAYASTVPILASGSPTTCTTRDWPRGWPPRTHGWRAETRGGRHRGKRARSVSTRAPGRSRSGRSRSTLEPSGLSWADIRLQRFISTTTLEVRGLSNRYRRPGLGAALAASLATGEASTQVVGANASGPTRRCRSTALLRIEDARASLATGKVRGRLELYAADQASTVMLDGQPQPLEVDPTAALAYQLEGNPLYELEIAAFLRAGVVGRKIPRDRAQDGLFTLRPYRRGKIPIVLVHGTASSPPAGPSW